MAARPVCPDDREQWPKLRRWWFGWWRNRDGGYRRIQGALANLGHVLAHNTIAKILKQHGIEPAPERSRKTTWRENEVPEMIRCLLCCRTRLFLLTQKRFILGVSLDHHIAFRSVKNIPTDAPSSAFVHQGRTSNSMIFFSLV
jgi:hypothetical protein